MTPLRAALADRLRALAADAERLAGALEEIALVTEHVRRRHRWRFAGGQRWRVRLCYDCAGEGKFWGLPCETCDGTGVRS